MQRRQYLKLTGAVTAGVPVLSSTVGAVPEDRFPILESDSFDSFQLAKTIEKRRQFRQHRHLRQAFFTTFIDFKSCYQFYESTHFYFLKRSGPSEHQNREG
jgi:hypothetical protein